MKNLKLIILFTFVLVTTRLIAQNNYEEVVYLKNGSVIRGLIIEQVPQQSIKIQTKDRNIFVFKYLEIEKITKEIISPKVILQDENPKELVVEKNGKFNRYTEINFCPGIGDYKPKYSYTTKNNNYSFGIRTSFGYQFNEQIFLGASIGIDKHKISYNTIPLTAEIRYKVVKGKISPLLSANVGYALKSGYLKGGGYIINTQIGIKTKITENLAYLFNVGYKWQVQEVKYYYLNNPTFIYSSKALLNYFTISTGFSF
jgi:hypothetical protein